MDYEKQKQKQKIKIKWNTTSKTPEKTFLMIRTNIPKNAQLPFCAHAEP
jgi:hypothetical protein